MISDPHADQIVEVPVRQPFDVEVDWCALNHYFWSADDVDFLLSNGQRPQRVVILFPFAAQPFDLGRRRGRKVWESCVTVKIPLSWSFFRSLSVIPANRLKSSFSSAFSRHRV